MDYWERLAQGSEFHSAERSGNTLKLYPVPETDPQRREFNKIARDAMHHATAEGHDVLPHEPTSDSYGLNFLVITFK
jgi:hypothetical protein